MFVRTVKAKGKEYLRIVESVRVEGKTRQRVVAHLGNVATLGPQVDQLIEGLRRFAQGTYAQPEELENAGAREYGAIAVGERLWEELGLKVWLEQAFAQTQAEEVGELYARVMVLNRLCDPHSKLGIFEWLEDAEVPGWEVPRGLSPEERKVLAERFYRTLDYLVGWKEKIEQHLYLRCRDLFNLQVDVVFYDVTSTYFEGEGPPELGQRGKSRDGHPREKQIVVGLVMCQGLPIAHHVWAGNRIDKKTVQEVVKDLQKRFGVGRFIFVGDRGMVSPEVIEFLEEGGYCYVVALRRRRCRESRAAVQVKLGKQDQLEEGFFGREVVGAGDEVAEEEWGLAQSAGRRLMVFLNESRREEEKHKREDKQEQLQQELEALQTRVKQGRLKDPAKIGAAAERILSRRNGKRYFRYAVKGPGQFAFQPHTESLALEKLLDGKFVLLTNCPPEELSVREGVQTYKQLHEVEEGFRDLKSFLGLRPIYHRKDQRVKGHVLVCVLAYLLEQVYAQKLGQGQVEWTARRALKRLRRLKVVEDHLGKVRVFRMTQASPEEWPLLQAAGWDSWPKLLAVRTEEEAF